MIEINMSEEQKRLLEKQLWGVAKDLKKLYMEEIGLQSKIAEFCGELGIGKPF